MKIVAMVPIKLNNERLPGKNIKTLGGKPLIAYCLETLLKMEHLHDIYVYCSSDSIVPFLPQRVTFFKRSETLDLPESNFTQIFEAFSSEIAADIYVYAHATAPFVKTDTIRSEIDAVQNHQFDSAFCAEKIQDYLWQDGKPLNFNQRDLPRSQDLPVIFRETSGVYVFKKEVFDKYRSRIGVAPYIVEVTRKEAVDINTADDFRYAEIMLNAIL